MGTLSTVGSVLESAIGRERPGSIIPEVRRMDPQ